MTNKERTARFRKLAKSETGWRGVVARLPPRGRRWVGGRRGQVALAFAPGRAAAPLSLILALAAVAVPAALVRRYDLPHVVLQSPGVAPPGLCPSAPDLELRALAFANWLAFCEWRISCCDM